MGSNFNNYFYYPSNQSTNEVEQSKNHVEITPEQQAEIDAAKKSKDNEALANALNGGNNKDSLKGVALEKQQQPVRSEMGNGITRITNPDGTIEFEIDYAKGYDGTDQLFEKGTKVTYLNKPEEPEKSLVEKAYDFAEKIDEKVNEFTRGNIKKAGTGVIEFIKTFGKIVSFPVRFLTGCSDQLDVANASVNFLTKDAADYVVNYLNDPDNALGLGRTTADGVEFEYGYDYNNNTKVATPYIDFGNGLKLYINKEPLDDLTANNIVNYINIVGEKLTTADGVDYNFQVVDNEAQVKFGNGLTHNVDDDVTIDKDGPTGMLSSMLSSVGLAYPGTDSTKIAMNLKVGKGSYDNNSAQFEIGFETPARLKDITSGKEPRVEGNIKGITIKGKAEKPSEKLTLKVNGEEKEVDGSNGVLIKNDDGVEIYMQYEEGFDLRIQDPENANQEPILYNGVVIYVKNQNGVFEERYIMSKHNDSKTDIGKIDRVGGTTLQNYSSEATTFDPDSAIKAKEYYEVKNKNLDKAYRQADDNFKYVNRWEYNANANVSIK